MDTANNIGYLINHLVAVLERQSNQILLEQLGIGFSQFKILMVLKRNHGVRQKDIASKLVQTEASVSRQIKLLLDKGLLKIIVRPQNRRQYIAVLTTKGEKIIDQSLELLNEYYSPILQELTPSQQSELIKILGIMHARVCLDAGSCACSSLTHR